jgi:hypothetical protein
LEPSGAHIVTVHGPAAPWTLDYFELATHHGSTSFLFVLPHNSTAYQQPSVALICIFALTLGGLLAAQPSVSTSAPRWIRISFGLAALLIVVGLAAIQCSQWVSNYRLILSTEAFAAWTIVLMMPRLWGIARRLELTDGTLSYAAILVKSTLVGILVLIAYFAVVNARVRVLFHGNYSGLLAISKHDFDGNPLLNQRADIRSALVLQSNAYDAEFMYFAIFDPFLRAYRHAPATYRSVVDAPPYRYGRIGFSLLAKIGSRDRWPQYPSTMIWLILSSLFLGAVVLGRLAGNQGLTPAIGGLIVLVPSFWTSVQFGLPEPVATAALLGGIFSLSKGRWVVAALCFALSLLVRETGIMAIGCFAAASLIGERRRDGLIAGACSVCVLILWRLYVAWALFPDWGIEGLTFHPPDLGWPLMGIVQLWQTIAHGLYYPGSPDISRAGAWFPLLLISGFLLAVWLAVSAPSAQNVAAVMYGLLALSLNFPAIWIAVSNAQRGTYELFVMLALGSLGIRTYARSLRLGLIGFWFAAASYVLFGAYDARFIRGALGLPF